MKTQIEEPITYHGWTIKLYLENGGFSFQVTAPDYLPLGPIENSRLYTNILDARLAAKKLVKVERAALSLENWLVEMYGEGQLSLEEFESLSLSMRQIYEPQGGKS